MEETPGRPGKSFAEASPEVATSILLLRDTEQSIRVAKQNRQVALVEARVGRTTLQRMEVSRTEARNPVNTDEEDCPEVESHKAAVVQIR